LPQCAIKAFPALEVPFPEDVVQTRAIASDRGLVVFFHFLKDFVLPEHSHLGQWGTLLEGEVELTVGGETRLCNTPGDVWDIPGGVLHSGLIKAGTKLIEVFEEPDRYPIRAGS